MTFWLILILIIFIQSEISAVDYCARNMRCNYRIENSGCDCSFGSKCKAPKEHIVTTEIRKAIVNAHNKYREKVASGEETRGGMSKGATQMFMLQFDDGLQHTATCWNKKCLFDHDKCRITKTFRPVGQNIHLSYAKACDWELNLQSAMHLWYEEVKYMTASCFKSYGKGCNTSKVSHFTQIVWAKTTHVGCSFIEHSGTMCQIICNYGPTGNYQREPVLEMGTTAEKCRYKSEYFKSLCLLSANEEKISKDYGDDENFNDKLESPHATEASKFTLPTRGARGSYGTSINRSNHVMVGLVYVFVWFIKLSPHVSYL